MFTDQVGLVGEWEWYDIDKDVDLLSIGVLIKF
jgi:OOP family OmpA-OmpF porin